MKPLWCVEDEGAYQALHHGMARFMGIEQMFDGLSIHGRDPHR